MDKPKKLTDAMRALAAKATLKACPARALTPFPLAPALLTSKRPYLSSEISIALSNTAGLKPSLDFTQIACLLVEQLDLMNEL